MQGAQGRASGALPRQLRGAGGALATPPTPHHRSTTHCANHMTAVKAWDRAAGDTLGARRKL